MSTSTLTSKGQVTIPKPVRERLRVRAGDRLLFRFDDRGQLVVRPDRTAGLDVLVGCLRRYARDRPATIEEMNQAVKQRAAHRQRTGTAR